jgi:DNA-binding beta-propeller fold protein YncE
VVRRPRERRVCAGIVLPVLLTVVGSCASPPEETSTLSIHAGVPAFEVDPSWPALPAGWTWGEVLGVSADANDHVWLTTLGRVAEFDAHGAFVQEWSARGESGQWSVIHGLFIDHNGYVWTGARDEHQILKFTRDGKLVLTIGRLSATGGSNDPALLGRPSEIYVSPDSNEVFVADGYTNRRVVVFDAATGLYLRHWGAYGKRPEDIGRVRRADDDATAAPQFTVVHGITGSRDGLIYVGDRQNNRIQVFDRSGKYVAERIIRPGSGAAFSVVLSHDPQQQFVFVADGTEHKVWILRRADLAVVGQLGSEGSGPGQLGITHNLATDSRGHLYVAEAVPGLRAQKFTFKGVVSAPP